MEREKLIIEIDTIKDRTGIGCRVVHALTTAINTVFDEGGIIDSESGELFDDEYYDCCHPDDPEEKPLLEIKYRWVKS